MRGTQPGKSTQPAPLCDDAVNQCRDVRVVVVVAAAAAAGRRRFADADKYAVRGGKDGAHHGDLRAALGAIALVDAQGISPEEAGLVGVARALQGPVEVGRDRCWVSVTVYGDRGGLVAPDIGESVVGRRGGLRAMEEAEGDGRIAVGGWREVDEADFSMAEGCIVNLAIIHVAILFVFVGEISR